MMTASNFAFERIQLSLVVVFVDITLISISSKCK
jgi:hypothetical protein